MMHFVRNVESFSIRDTIQDDVPSAEFDLIANNQIIPLPKNLFIFISPLLRKIFRSILPCFRPQVTIPDVPKIALELFTDIVTSVCEQGFEKIIDLEELKLLDELFGFLQIDTKYFKIEVADIKDVKEYIEVIEENEIKPEFKEEPTIDFTHEYDLKDKNFIDEIEELDTEKEFDPKNGSKLESTQEVSPKKDGGVLKQKLICQFCEEEYKFQHDLIQHLRIHVEEISYKELVLFCPFENCGRSFGYLSSFGVKVGKVKQLSHLEEHMRAKHTKIPSKICIKCNKNFFSQMSFNYHKRQHLDKSKFYCDKCDHFIHNVLLERHKNQCDISKKTVWKCNTCDKSYPSRNLSNATIVQCPLVKKVI